MGKEEHCTQSIPNDSPQNFYLAHSPLRILLAEDDFEMRKMLSWYLQKICFRHDLEGEHIKDFVYNMAAKLNRFSHHIEHCRVVLDQSGTHHQKNRLYHVMITIDMPGKTIAVKHDSETEAGFENLYLSIHFAFGAAIRRLKRYLKKCYSPKRG